MDGKASARTVCAGSASTPSNAASAVALRVGRRCVSLLLRAQCQWRQICCHRELAKMHHDSQRHCAGSTYEHDDRRHRRTKK
eukprot:6210905-Pleurochrysis_carterae.AAC.2